MSFPWLDHVAIGRCLPHIVLLREEITPEILALVLPIEAHNLREVVDAAAYLLP
jgi:hypothetical protein